MNSLHHPLRLLLLVLALGCGSAADSRAPDGALKEREHDVAGAEAAARDFYAWYVPLADSARVSGPRLVLAARPELLVAPLRLALAEDLARQERTPDVVVGLDFDPFLGGQDTCPPYAVGPARRVADGIEVPVRGACAGDRRAPDAVVRWTPAASGGWAITDVDYPAVGGERLTDILRELAADHARGGKHGD